ncbi:MAG: anti-anti-sigma factor [Porticoccus sp.]|nr:anti-anti-sigma factor [Porticoccus sp.]
MDLGRILVSQKKSSYFIRLEGDVRVVLSASLNDYMNIIFKSKDISKIIIDMIETKGVDSTTLGLLAKLAIYSNENFKIRPIVFCPDESLHETLLVMGLDDVFEIVSQKKSELENYEELKSKPTKNVIIKKHVLEAHKLLSSISMKNKEEFLDLIAALERE